MPAKNAIKIYLENGYYHIYNRGVNKSNIFSDKQDYSVFLSYLKTYLSPQKTDHLSRIIANPKSSPVDKDLAIRELRLNNFHQKIQLLTYCLMPNHFHLLVRQSKKTHMTSFMKSFMGRYSAYFNKRHQRLGPLFQGKYKAILVESDPQLLHLTRYIHRNPLNLHKQLANTSIAKLLKSQPSSYPNYLKEINQHWVKPKFILQNFSKSGFNSYRSFVEDHDFDLEEQTLSLIKDITLDLQ